MLELLHSYFGATLELYRDAKDTPGTYFFELSGSYFRTPSFRTLTLDTYFPDTLLPGPTSGTYFGATLELL